MKKIFAIALALMLALSCTLALAEPAAAFQGKTVQSDYDVDREVLKNALTQFGLDEATINIADTVAAIVSEAGEKAVIAPDGLQYELLLKGTSLFNLVAKLSDAGLTVGTSLLPGYAINVSMEEIGQALEGMSQQMAGLQALDTDALTQAFSGYVNTFVDACTGAITPGEPEQGDFVLDGISYNVKVPVNVDVAAIVDAANTMSSDMLNDETIKGAIETLKGMGMTIDLPESTEVAPVDPASLPTVTIDAYMTIDEQGNQGDTTDVVFQVTPAGTEEVATMGDVLVQGQNVRVMIQFLSAGINFACTVEPSENGGSTRVDIDYNNVYAGYAAVCDHQGDTTNLDSYVYLMDDQKPLFTSHTTVTEGGALTLSPDGEGKTVVALADLTGDNAEETTGSMAMDFLLNGLGALMTTASQLMPEEIGAVTSLIMGGSETPAA